MVGRLERRLFGVNLSPSTSLSTRCIVILDLRLQHRCFPGHVTLASSSHSRSYYFLTSAASYKPVTHTRSKRSTSTNTTPCLTFQTPTRSPYPPTGPYQTSPARQFPSSSHIAVHPSLNPFCTPAPSSPTAASRTSMVPADFTS